MFYQTPNTTITIYIKYYAHSHTGGNTIVILIQYLKTVSYTRFAPSAVRLRRLVCY